MITRHVNKGLTRLSVVIAATVGIYVGVTYLNAQNHGPAPFPIVEAPPKAKPMNQQRLEQVIRDAAGKVQGQPGAIQFIFNGVAMMCLSDAMHDRMRLIAPIIQADQITNEQMTAMLEANFHTALDARYATSQGILYAAYIHPLSPLTDHELRSALRQVASLAKTFGTAYTSGELQFGQPEQPRTPDNHGTQPRS